MRRALGFVLAIAILVTAAAASAGVKDVMKEADGYYAQRAKAGMIDKAIETYQQALALDDSLVEAYSKLARAYYFKGTRAPNDGKAAAAFREGIEFAKLGVAVDDGDVGAHFWLAVSYGKFGEVKGIMQSLHLVDPLMKEAKRALALDERYLDGGPHRVLCRVYVKLPGFKGGDVDKAIAHCEKALEFGPNEHMNHVFMAEALIEKGDKAKAKEHLQKVLDTPPHPKLKPEHEDMKKLAKKMLSDLGG